MALLSGKATADNLAKQYGVHVDTVLSWRDAAVAAIDQAMVVGGGPSPREKELEQQNAELRSALAQAVVEDAHTPRWADGRLPETAAGPHLLDWSAADPVRSRPEPRHGASSKRTSARGAATCGS